MKLPSSNDIFENKHVESWLNAHPEYTVYKEENVCTLLSILTMQKGDFYASKSVEFKDFLLWNDSVAIVNMLEDLKKQIDNLERG